ncbi:argininosuccinate synthase [Lactarius hengduanensis]|nr:argininosuccinate synthase [Lactarius hengduanensis]
MWKLTSSLGDAPTSPEFISIEFKAGRKHGIGRIDIVENRFIGVKSRGCYESPGATILRVAHIDLEGLTLDRNVRALRDQFVTIELGRILYNGHFFTPEREFVTSAIPASQRTVNGVVRLKLYKGNVVVGPVYDEKQSSMDELGGFEPTDTTGFIQIESIRIKKWAQANLLKGRSGVEPKDVYGARV